MKKIELSVDAMIKQVITTSEFLVEARDHLSKMIEIVKGLDKNKSFVEEWIRPIIVLGSKTYAGYTNEVIAAVEIYQGVDKVVRKIEKYL
jgi:hypothetical protein